MVWLDEVVSVIATVVAALMTQILRRRQRQIEEELTAWQKRFLAHRQDVGVDVTVETPDQTEHHVDLKLSLVDRIGPQQLREVARLIGGLDRVLRGWSRRRQERRPHLVIPPGHHLRRWARFFFSERACERVFDELIADMREEYHEALMKGDRHRASLVLWRYRLAFAKTVILASGLGALLGAILKRVSND